MPTNPALQIRKAQPTDIDDILAIENQRFPNPWGKKYFTGELSHDISYFYVAEDTISHRAAGYIIFWIVEKEAELHKIAVAREYDKKGIGKELFLFMLETAARRKVEEVFLEVRKSNTGAIKFYEAFHFTLLNTREDYYSDPTEDALIYRLKLDSPSNFY